MIPRKYVIPAEKIGKLRKDMKARFDPATKLLRANLIDYYKYLGDQARAKGGDHVDQWAHEMEMMALDTAHPATLTNDQLQEEIDRLKLAALNASAYPAGQLENKIDKIVETITARTETINKTIIEYANSPEVKLTVKLEDLSARLQGMADTQAAATELGFAGLTDAVEGMWEVNWEEAIAEMQKTMEKMEMGRIKKLAETIKGK